MKFPAIIACLSVVLLFAATGLAQTDTRSSKTWEVMKYDLAVTLPATENERSAGIRATLNLKNVSGSSASSLTLRISQKAEVSSVKLAGSQSDFTKNEEKLGTGSLQRIVMRGLSVQPGGTTSVEVNYSLKVEDNSGLSTLTPYSSQFLPLSFWYPTPTSWYYPRGGDFAPYRVQVAAPGGVSVFSAGTASGGAFEQALSGQPFFVTGSYETLNDKGVEVALAKGAGEDERKRASEIAALASDAFAYYSGLLGTSPAAKLRIVAVKRGSGFADAGTLLLDQSVFKREKIDALTAMNVAEAMVRVWLGAATTISGDGGGAVREGLVRFLATQFIESKFGKDVGDLERMRQRTAYAAVVKRDAPISQITPLDDYYYVTDANKGAMVWRLLARRTGIDSFIGVLKANMKLGGLDLAGLRGAFGQQKELLDYAFDQVTDMDLLVGLPQAGSGETRVALRNTGSIDALVDVTAVTDKGETLRNTMTIKAKDYGDAIFKTTSKLVRVEVDADKLYPQLDYANDIKPLVIDESDGLLFVKKVFDRQDFPQAETNARAVLRDTPRFDDVRVLLGRALLAEGKIAEAEREFKAVLDEKLPTARSLAWANTGLGEAALKNNQPTAAIAYFDRAIRSGGEIGASFAARQGRLKANASRVTDESIKSFFQAFDKAALSSSKAALDALIVSGELPKAFAAGIAGQAQEWTSSVTQMDVIDTEHVVVEVALTIKIINKSEESGNAVFRLTKTPEGWKLSGVESFEVR